MNNNRGHKIAKEIVEIIKTIMVKKKSKMNM